MSIHGNRITDNALTADSGENLITKAIHNIEQNTEWHVSDKEKFAGAHGVYYDSKKIGSFFVEVENKKGVKGVLKLQLRPLPFDEGFIIHFIERQIKSQIIRLLKIYLDNAWNEKDGYGFLIFGDVSHLHNLWKNLPPSKKEDFQNHKIFLKEFLNNILPIEPFIERPKETPLQQAEESFGHFFTIATNSSHKHIEVNEILEYKEKYFNALKNAKFGDLHFTHGHLTGLDVKVDNRQFVVLANLYWKWRPKYYELIFPVWNSLMQVRNRDFSFDDFMEIVHHWNELWSTELYDHNPILEQQYWISLLGFAMNTIMLDLGSSEWIDGEKEEKATLLKRWKDFFEWIIENKF